MVTLSTTMAVMINPLKKPPRAKFDRCAPDDRDYHSRSARLMCVEKEVSNQKTFECKSCDLIVPVVAETNTGDGSQQASPYSELRVLITYSLSRNKPAWMNFKHRAITVIEICRLRIMRDHAARMCTIRRTTTCAFPFWPRGCPESGDSLVFEDETSQTLPQ